MLSKSFGISKVMVKGGYEMENSHSHNHYELFYMLSGECTMILGHNIVKVASGDIVIIPPQEIHKTKYPGNSNDNYERIVLKFEPSDIESMLVGSDGVIIEEALNSGVVTIPANRKNYFENILMEIVFENDRAINSNNKIECYQTMIKSLLQIIIVLFVRYQKYDENADKCVETVDSLIQEIATYVYNNYDKQIYLNDVANQFHISRSYLSKKFKNVTGYGFKEYLLDVRIKEASKMLLETDKSIIDIAFLCGFNDSNYFGDAFRRIKGISPNKYRKNQHLL